MSLKSHDAIDALVAALDASAALPAVAYNDLSLSGFTTTATAGVGWRLGVADDDLAIQNAVLGHPLHFELGVWAQVVLAVEGVPGDDRDGVLRAGMQALADVLFPGGEPLAIAGKFDGLWIADGIETQHILSAETGVLPIEAIRFRVELSLTAPTPFG